jgi:hypothetical protein
LLVHKQQMLTLQVLHGSSQLVKDLLKQRYEGAYFDAMLGMIWGTEPYGSQKRDEILREEKKGTIVLLEWNRGRGRGECIL